MSLGSISYKSNSGVLINFLPSFSSYVNKQQTKILKLHNNCFETQINDREIEAEICQRFVRLSCDKMLSFRSSRSGSKLYQSLLILRLMRKARSNTKMLPFECASLLKHNQSTNFEKNFNYNVEFEQKEEKHNKKNKCVDKNTSQAFIQQLNNENKNFSSNVTLNKGFFNNDNKNVKKDLNLNKNKIKNSKELIVESKLLKKKFDKEQKQNICFLSNVDSFFALTNSSLSSTLISSCTVQIQKTIVQKQQCLKQYKNIKYNGTDLEFLNKNYLLNLTAYENYACNKKNTIEFYNHNNTDLNQKIKINTSIAVSQQNINPLTIQKKQKKNNCLSISLDTLLLSSFWQPSNFSINNNKDVSNCHPIIPILPFLDSLQKNSNYINNLPNRKELNSTKIFRNNYQLNKFNDNIHYSNSNCYNNTLCHCSKIYFNNNYNRKNKYKFFNEKNVDFSNNLTAYCRKRKTSYITERNDILEKRYCLKNEESIKTDDYDVNDNFCVKCKNQKIMQKIEDNTNIRFSNVTMYEKPIHQIQNIMTDQVVPVMRRGHFLGPIVGLVAETPRILMF